jgi:hypothetical protein
LKILEKIKKSGPSLIVLVIIAAFFIIYSEIKKSERSTIQIVVQNDPVFYHEYIAVHIFGMKPYFPRSERIVIKYTMGMAVTYMPGIGIGYLLSEINGVDHQYGKNNYYQLVFYYLGFFYAFMGLVFLRLILKKWFDDFLVAIVLSIIFFGTNLYFYVKVDPLMSHAPSFCFITAFVYCSLRWLEKQTFKSSICAGILLGMIVLIRPTNIIIILFPLVYMLTKPEVVKSAQNKWGTIFILVTIPILFFIPQMMYWHHFTGKWLYNAYGNEGFFWSKPAILQILFSFRKGWFIYTPVMLFIIPGFIFCYKKNRSLFWAILVFTIVDLYLISSWWCWWYGGSFGMRALIDIYGLMAILLTFFLGEVYKRSRILFIGVLIICGFTTYLNLHQTRLARINTLHYDSMTSKAFMKIFMIDNHRKFTNEEWDALLDPPDYNKALKGERFW